jgi:acylphosphatase
MIQWCEQGPPHAAVEEVESEFEASKGDLERFEVR